MSDLYIANTSKQNHLFCYRLPENPSFRTQEIPPGGQVRLPGDLSTDEVRRIIDHHKQYGLVDSRELSRADGFVGICYSLGAPVNIDAILGTFERNDGELNDRAQERRDETAAAIASSMSERLGVRVARAEVEQVESGTVTGPVRDTSSPQFAVGSEVVADNVAPRHPGKQRRGDAKSVN
jgi:hypothetical protein